jgi:hypothetical protein
MFPVKTTVSIDGPGFLINNHPTYEGLSYRGHSIEGLLFNSRMVQAVFDDENPQTRMLWAYPDTGAWDPDRNTAEFCSHLADYRKCGLLAVTVGLQGGGSVYTRDIYDNYACSAFAADGSFKPAYFDRLLRVIRAADDLGMVVIVNYFYVKQVARIPDDRVILDITARATEWLLKTGFQNVIVDVVNEAGNRFKRSLFGPEGVHQLIECVKATTVNGRRLLAGASAGGGREIPQGRWFACEDFSMPHGNGCTPAELRDKLRRLRSLDEYKARPRPILINEDGTILANLETAIEEYASWGFYTQGYGSQYTDLSCDWKLRPRESSFADLSGFQTLPVNWAINSPEKKAFFDRLSIITRDKA